jgi:hypothetical protein
MKQGEAALNALREVAREQTVLDQIPRRSYQRRVGLRFAQAAKDSDCISGRGKDNENIGRAHGDSRLSKR